MKSVSLLAMAVAVAVAGTVLADANPNTSSADVFDSTRGTTIVSTDAIADPINVFRTSGGFEDGHALMRNGGIGSVSFINFRTPQPVTLTAVRMFAGSDGAANGNRRAMNRFRLLVDENNDGTYEAAVVDRSVNVDYSQIPGDADPSQNGFDLTVPLAAPTTASNWRLEVTQGTNLQPFEGARVIELDGIGFVSNPVPGSSTWAQIALLLGLLGAGLFALRRAA